MIEVVVKRKYDDIELNRTVLPKEKLEVEPARAKKLASLGLVDITKIFKLTKKEYEQVISD